MAVNAEPNVPLPREAVAVAPQAEASERGTSIATLRALMPHLSASDTAIGTIRGGRAAALAALHAINPQSYAGSRNYLDGSVTRLSPYLRHGVLTLAEVRDHALAVVDQPQQALRLIQELAWRDYWQRLYTQLGDGIWLDREPIKTGRPNDAYIDTLPPELGQAATPAHTGLACIDAFAQDLVSTGYLHNHARMWMAAWLIHWQHVRWQAGARWFLEHLLDGDPASNNLSWQWVASTFSAKPYIFNRENLQRYTANKYCATCPRAAAHTCPFDHSYDELNASLFAGLEALDEPFPSPKTASHGSASRGNPRIANAAAGSAPLLWIHTDSLNPELAAFREHPDRPSIFVWDTDWLTQEHISLKRAVFIAECLDALPPSLTIQAGDAAEHVLAAARASNSDCILAQRTPDPRLLRAAAAIAEHIPVVWFDQAPFLDPNLRPDLRRFSRYWQKAQTSAMQPTYFPVRP
jgi:deoxyribodipyrimidine photo-lyase